jgi:ribonuclease HI
MRRLPAGTSIISVYADASFSSDLDVGCWAFSIPSFTMSSEGIEAGCCNNRLELAGVVHGVAAVVALDYGRRGIRVHTDSDFVITVMRHVGERSSLPSTKGFRRVSDLYQQACDLSCDRSLIAVRRALRDPHHTACDRRARQHLRAFCSADGRLSRAVLLKRAESRKAALTGELSKLEAQLDRVDKQLLQCEIEIAALSERGEYDLPLRMSPEAYTAAQQC